MQKKSNLGRGLDALLGRKAEAKQGQQNQPQPEQTNPENITNQTNPEAAANQLPLEQIVRASYQPRQNFDPDALSELAQSIREKGVLQPLLVRPLDSGNYEIVAGERRWRAAQLAGLSEVPVIVRQLSDTDALEIAIIENLQRESLSPVEEARAYQTLIQKGRKQEEVAQAVGKSRSTITNALRLLSLPNPILSALEDGQIGSGHAKAILSHPQDKRLWAFEQITSRQLSVREAEQLNQTKQANATTDGQEGHDSDDIPNDQTVQAEQGISSTATDDIEGAHAQQRYHQVELVLSRRTGTKVKINDKGLAKGKGGKLELSFGSREELERLLELLGYAEGE